MADDASCGLNPAAPFFDLPNTNPLLGALADNGGPTLTMLPGSGSPTIGIIPSSPATVLNGRQVCPGTDQRLYPTVGACAIGAADPHAISTPPNGVSVGSGSVAEGDTGKPRTITFPVVLPAPSTSTVTVGYSIEAAGATNAATACVSSATCAPGSGGDFFSRTGTLTFKPSATTGLTPTVKYVNALVYPDTAAEGDETFRVVLSNPVGVGLGLPVGTGTILDDDPVGGTPQVAIGDASILEGNTGVKATTTNNAKVWVTLSEPATGPVTVKVTVTPTGATANTDFKYGSVTSVFPVTKTITFAAGQWQKPVVIGVFPDTVAEGDETVSVTISDPTGGPVLGRSTATLRIMDDD